MRVALLLTGLAVAAPLGPAMAQSLDDPVPAVVVSYADLNLSTPADAAKMLHRIRRAAVEVCHQDSMMVGTDLVTVQRFDSCRREAMARALAKLNAPLVTEASGGRTLASLRPAALTPSGG